MAAVFFAGNNPKPMTSLASIIKSSSCSSSSSRYPLSISGSSSRFLPPTNGKGTIFAPIPNNLGCNFCRLPAEYRPLITAAKLPLSIPAPPSFTSILLFNGEINNANTIFSPTHDNNNPHLNPGNWRSKKKKTLQPPRAKPRDHCRYTDGRVPPMTRKPQWWWRTLADLPYLLPLHQTWMYAETSYNLHRFLEYLELVLGPSYLNLMTRLPRWFTIFYYLTGYFGVVKRKDIFPHFFRFHVIMGLLIGTVLHVVGYTWKLVPRSVYWSKTGMHFWVAFTFAFFFTVLECIRCAICGIYAEVPGLDTAAYVDTDPFA